MTTGFSFYCDGVECTGQLAAKVGEYLVVEGLAMDTGQYFLTLSDGYRRFDSRQKALDYAQELAQDALSHEEEEYNRELAERLRNMPKGGKLPPGRRPPPTRDAGIAMDPLTGKGEKIMSSMKGQYGGKKGEQVFYASRNAGKIKGVDAEDPKTERAMRDRMNGIVRDKDGKIISIRGKPVGAERKPVQDAEKMFDWEVTLGMVDHNGQLKTKTIRVAARNKEEAIEQAEGRWASYDPGTGSVGHVRKMARDAGKIKGGAT